MKNQKGITLIALVITIIVLLILAGVSIAMLTGDNGILTKSKTARDETRDGTIKEALNLAVSTITANRLDPTYKAPGSDKTDLSQFGSKAVAEVIKNDNANSKAVSSDTATDGTGKIDYKYQGTWYEVKFGWLYAGGKTFSDAKGDASTDDNLTRVGIDLSSVTIQKATNQQDSGHTSS